MMSTAFAATQMTPDELKAARSTLGLTQVEFARAFQVSQRAVRGWEAGTRNGRTHAIPPPNRDAGSNGAETPDRLELGIR